MNQHRYILEPYKGMKTRFNCPECGQKQTFSRYIDTETGNYIADGVGRCNRETKCGYHYTPAQYFEKTGINPMDKIKYVPDAIYNVEVKKQPSFIEFDLFKKSLAAYENNNFIKYLISLFGTETTTRLIEKYYIGTSKHWPGSTIFWQVDENMKVHTGKVMLYNSYSGKRIKEPFNHVAWVHKLINEPEFELKQCFFGQHLLKDKAKPVSIIESEKTAIIASAYFPNVIWLACGGLNGLNVEKCQCLKGRNVTLWPDLRCFDKWQQKAIELSIELNTQIKVSDFLEHNVTDEFERLQGYDLADYLVLQDYNNIHKEDSKINTKIVEYWFGWETCFKDFQSNPERQMIYHNEFTKLYQPCDFETFKNETKRLINHN
jgi:rubredoxin